MRSETIVAPTFVQIYLLESQTSFYLSQTVFLLLFLFRKEKEERIRKSFQEKQNGEMFSNENTCSKHTWTIWIAILLLLCPLFPLSSSSSSSSACFCLRHFIRVISFDLCPLLECPVCWNRFAKMTSKSISRVLIFLFVFFFLACERSQFLETSSSEYSTTRLCSVWFVSVVFFFFSRFFFIVVIVSLFREVFLFFKSRWQ